MSPQEFQRRNAPSPLAIPGQTQVNFQHLGGPLAQPVAVTFNGPQGSNTIVYGGLTARVTLAAYVVGSLGLKLDENGDIVQRTVEERAAEALDLAEALLQADHARMIADREAQHKAAEEAAAAAASADSRTPGGIALP